MPDSTGLNELEIDLLRELFNLGVGRAAASLSKIVSQEVLLSIPEIAIVDAKTLVSQLENTGQMISIGQNIDAPFNARSMLLFPEESSMELVRYMLGEHLSEELIVELQKDALSEIGNIVLNACIGAISKGMRVNMNVGLPEVESGLPGELKHDAETRNNIALLLKIEMQLKESEISGYLAFLLGATSFEQIQSVLKAMVDNLSKG